MNTDEPVQLWSQKIGSFGCYFLCLLKRFGKELDAIRWYKKFLDEGIIRADCYIKRPEELVRELSGKKWTVRFGEASYKPEKDEFVVLHWSKDKMEHFTLEDWDPLGNSLTRASGHVDSVRIYKEIPS